MLKSGDFEYIFSTGLVRYVISIDYASPVIDLLFCATILN